MRTLPRNISALPHGLVVRVVRWGVIYRAFVGTGLPIGRPSRQSSMTPRAFAESLARAVALRDRFIRIAGEVNRHRVRGHSNTGLAGISETTKWRRNHRLPGFAVSWRERGRQKVRSFFYGQMRTRERARAQAIAWREHVTGLKLTPVS